MKEDELGILKAMAFHRDEVAVAVGFHPAMLSSDAATYSNLATGRELEWQIVVTQNARVASAFTGRLVQKKDRGKIIIAPDYSAVEELQGLANKIKNCAEMVQKCRIAVNDAIRASGLPVPNQAGGDFSFAEGNLVLASSIEDGNQD